MQPQNSTESVASSGSIESAVVDSNHSNVDIFANTNFKICTDDNVLKCPSVARINMVLTQFERISLYTSSTQSRDALKQLIHTMFMNNGYTNSHLINDFHHIRYDHYVDDDDELFHELYCLFNGHSSSFCNVQQCVYIQRHWRDRSKFSNQYFFNDNTVDIDEKVSMQCTINLIEQIHVYFIHSYDINRLTLNQKHLIQEELEMMNDNALDEEQSVDDEFIKDKMIGITADIIMRKTKALKIQQNNDKFAIAVVDSKLKNNIVDSEVIQQILKANDISINVTSLKDAFKNYQNDKDTFIGGIIDAYYYNEDDTVIDTNQLHHDTEIRHRIYEHILYDYIHKEDLSNSNFIKIAKIIIKKLDSNIAVDQFEAIAANTDSRISGKIFNKTNDEFTKSIAFAQRFTSIPNYKKLHFTQIYGKIKQWKPIKSKPKPIQEKQSKTTDEKKEEMLDDDNIKDDKKPDVYELGVQFYFWDSYKMHHHYIKPQSVDLKQETLQNLLFNFDVQKWDELDNECKVMGNTNRFKRILSNGNYAAMYEIKRFASFSVAHLTALKLYTDYTALSGIFCSTLRSADKTKIKQIAQWSKLLIECVQCYGMSIQSSTIKQYYRGMSDVFYFEMLITRIYLPLSTTTDYTIAISKFSGDGCGLVIELRQYKDKCRVFKFDCAVFSVFPEEKESLFFGEDTILRISSILQNVDNKWKRYTIYMEPLNAIFRMINGLTIKEQEISRKKKHQKIMLRLIKYVLLTFDAENDAKKTMSISPYIDQLLKYHMFNAEIKLNYVDLVQEYQWMNKIFLKHKMDKTVLNLANICVLFSHSDNITFLMQNDYVLEDFQCKSIVENLEKITNMNIVVSICFKWTSNASAQNQLNINRYLHDLHTIQWKLTFIKNTMLFEVITAPSLTVDGQLLFQAIINEILSEPNQLIPNENLKNSEKQIIEFIPTVSITMYDISQRSIYTVNGYIRLYFEEALEQNVPSDVLYLVLLLYAKPLIMNLKYHNQMNYVLYDLLKDNWYSLQLKIKNRLSIFGDWELLHRNIRVIHFNWNNYAWDSGDVFTVEESRINQQLKDFDRIAATGQLFLKYTGKRRRKPQDRIVKVSFDRKYKPKQVSWGSGCRHIDFSDILYIAWGHWTPVFEARKDQLDKRLCFSVVGRQQILDVLAQSEEITELWVKGLRKLIGHSDAKSDKLAKEALESGNLPFNKNKDISEAKRADREHKKRTKALMLLQQDLFVTVVTTAFRNLEEERIWDIDQSVRKRFNAKSLYEVALREDIPWRQWNGWVNKQIVTYLRDNNRIANLQPFAHPQQPYVHIQQQMGGMRPMDEQQPMSSSGMYLHPQMEMMQQPPSPQNSQLQSVDGNNPYGQQQEMNDSHSLSSQPMNTKWNAQPNKEEECLLSRNKSTNIILLRF